MVWIALLLGSRGSHAFDILNQDAVGGFDNVSVSLGGFMQPRFTASPEDVPQNIPGELGFAVARARLELVGEMTGPLSIDPKVSIELMPEARLVDGYLNLSTTELAELRFGQFKAPTNRSFLVSDKMTLFPERAIIADLVPRRELGAMLHGRLGENILTYEAGAFNGEGTNRLSNVNRKLLYAARLVVSPFGSPGTTSELLAKAAPFTLSLGASAHTNEQGDEGQQEAASGYDVEGFLHWENVTLQGEYLYRLTDWEDPDIPDYEQRGWYVQTGVYVPGNEWLETHIVAIGRVEQVDELIPVRQDVGLVGADDPAQDRREYIVGLTYLAGAELLSEPQDLRLQVSYALREELEDLPYDNNEWMVSAHVSF